jgi:predicted aldo/keto reductase-like oxidoreductase
MQYRKFGKLDWKVSALGFGAMRLPVIDGANNNIDVPEAIKMIRYAFDNGVNYIDSAYLYHGGNSERIVGQALKDGYREKVKVATKLPVRSVNSESDPDRIFNEQLERLQLEKIDFYLLHGLNKQGWDKAKKFNIIQWAEDKMAKGLIEHFGFSFHDEFDVFKEIIDGYDNWTFCQVQYNFMDIEYQAGRRGVEYAASKDLGIVVMEPLRGGLLGKQPPDQIVRAWETAPKKRTPVEWALLWVWNQPEISVALSGMSTMQQVVENVASADIAKPSLLTDEELSLIDRVREAYYGLCPVPCTGCGYCMPCPNGVDIPRIFKVLNEVVMYNDPRIGRMRYSGPMGIPEHQRADQCMQCQDCLMLCPQQIDIPYWLMKAHEVLGKQPPPQRGS